MTSSYHNLRRVVGTSLLWSFVGKSLLSVLGFATTVLLARLLGSQGYGLYSVLIYLMGIVATLASLGVETAVTRFVPELRVEGKLNEIRTMLRRLLLFRVGTWLVTSGILFFGARFIGVRVLGQTATEPYIRWLPVLLVTPFVAGIYTSTLTSFYQQRFINTVDVLSEVLKLSVIVLLLGFGLGVPGVLAAGLIAGLLSMVLTITKARKTLASLGATKPPEKHSGISLRRVLSFSGNTYLYALSGYVLGRGADVLLISRLTGDFGQVSIYNIAYGFMYASLSFLIFGLSGGWTLPLVSELQASGNSEGLRKLYSGIFEFVYVSTIPMAVGGIIMSRQLVPLIYGQEFAAAGVLAAWYFGFIIVGRMGGITATFLLGMNREKTLVRSRLTSGVLNVALNLALIPKFGALGAVWATGVSHIGYAVVEAWIAHRMIAPKYPLGFVAKIAASSAVMAASVLAVIHWNGERMDAVGSLCLVALGGLIYMLMIVALKPLSRENLTVFENMPFPFRKRLVEALSRPLPMPS